MLKLRAKNKTAEIYTYESVGPKFTTVAKNLEADVEVELATYFTAGEAVCKHFQLIAKYNLTPCTQL